MNKIALLNNIEYHPACDLPRPAYIVVLLSFLNKQLFVAKDILVAVCL